MTPSIFGLFFLFITVSTQLCNDVSYKYCGRKGSFPIEVLRDVKNVNLCQEACTLKPFCEFIVFDNVRKDCHLHDSIDALRGFANFIESCTFLAAPVGIDLDFCRSEDACAVMYFRLCSVCI